MRTAFTILATLALATPSVAAEMSDYDANADGVLSVEEFAAAFADKDPAVFGVVDTNEDGMIDPAEYAAATEAGGPLS
ncbi:MAG: hypothetical protein AAF761_03155 [Pseudomonadota bacterium]